MGAADELVKRILEKRRNPAGTGAAVPPEAPSAQPERGLLGNSGGTGVTPVTLVTGGNQEEKSPVPREAPCTVPPEALRGDVLRGLRNPSSSGDIGAMALAAKQRLAPTASVPVRKFLRREAETFSDEERELRDEKVLFVRMVEEFRIARNCDAQEAVSAVAALHMESFPLLATAGKNGKSALHYNNFRNWRNGCGDRPGLRDPVTGKVDYSRADLLLRNYGRTSKRYGDDRFWTAILAACNNLGEPQVSKNYRLLVRKFTQEAPDAEIPSLAQVYAELKKLPRRLLELNRKGPNWYLQHMRDYNERDPESIRPNEAWVGDTQQLDFFIRVETGRDEKGNPVFSAQRPWICVLMDIKSEFVISWEMGIGSIDNRVIRNAFGRGVWQYGRPLHFLTDNGKDYLKQGFTIPVVFTPDIAGSKVYEHSILKSLEIEHHRATAYNGRAKIVERFFSEMAKYYRVCRGYVGNTPASRPATADVWSKPVTNEYLMNIEEACRTMADFIGIYHSTPAVGSKFLKGMTPEEAFTEDKRVRRPQLTMAELYRRFLLPEPKPRKVDARGSSVTVGGLRYVTLLEDREKMWRYDGKPVMVKFDLSSREYCFLFDLDGTFLTVAHRPKQLPYFCRTPEDRALLREHQEWINAEIATLNTYTNDLTNGFHKLDVSTSFGLPPEEFEGRAKLKKLDTMRSVKGETHNPAVYVTAAEKRARLGLRGEDIRSPGSTDAKTGVKSTGAMKKFQRMLINHLTDTEEPETPGVNMNQIYDKEKNDDTATEHDFNPYK